MRESAVSGTEPLTILRLPSEVRDIIWGLVVLTRQPIMIHKRHRTERTTHNLYRLAIHRSAEDDQHRAASSLSLAFTCHQLYLEVAPIYYSKNVFRTMFTSSESDRSLEEFASDIGQENAKKIAYILVDGTCPGSLPKLSLFPHLQLAHFSCKGWASVFTEDHLGDLVQYGETRPGLLVMWQGMKLDSQTLIRWKLAVLVALEDALKNC